MFLSIVSYTGDEKFPKNPDGTVRYDYTPIMDTWAAMEKMVDEGLVRHIGLSNFNSAQVDEVRITPMQCGICLITALHLQVMTKGRIKPAVLQCECHPYLPQNELIAHCKKQGVVFEAYSPLGSPDRPWAKPGDPVILEVKYIFAAMPDKTVSVPCRTHGLLKLPVSTTSQLPRS